MKITLEHLTKKFRSINKKDPNDVIAVNDFSYEVPEGKLIGLLGPSGCGKSTVLNLICGLEKPTSGRILFDGVDVSDVEPEHRGIGLVFQNYALYPHLNVYQNIIFPLQNLRGKDKLPKDVMDKKVMDAARLVQIEKFLERRPAELSGGQQQRVAIARALVKMPKALLLDEPLSNLDARLRLQTREELRRIQRETGITTIFVTHDQEEAMSISDYILVMNSGRLDQYGKPQDIYDDPKNLFVAKFLGTPPINVFEGSIKNKKLVIGEEETLDFDAPDRDVWAGIRPEAMIPDDAGAFGCELERIEVMGRDTSVVCRHPLCQAPTVRAIIAAERAAGVKPPVARFTLKPSKVLVFDKNTEERIRPGAEAEDEK